MNENSFVLNLVENHIDNNILAKISNITKILDYQLIFEETKDNVGIIYKSLYYDILMLEMFLKPDGWSVRFFQKSIASKKNAMDQAKKDLDQKLKDFNFNFPI